MRKVLYEEADNLGYIKGWFWGFLSGICVSVGVWFFYIL